MTNRPRSIALVDIGYLFKKHWHLPSNANVRLAAAKGALRDLERLSEGVDHLIACCDWGPYKKREEIYAEYKANRPEREPEELQQLRYLMDEMKRIGYPIARVQGYEADDVIATLAKKYSEWCPDVRIVGPDKDMAQCITDRVVQFIPPTGERDWERRDGAGVVSKFGVFPAYMPMFQALTGDTGDNIPGVDKVGPKTAAEIVRQYPTPTKLAEALPTLSLRSVRNSDAIKASLLANWNNFILSLKLTTLHTNVPLDVEALLVKGVEQPAKQPLVDMSLEEPVIERNATPMPPPPEEPANDHDEALAVAVKAYQEKLPELQKAARSEDADEQYDAERRANEEHVDEPPPAPKPPVKATDWAGETRRLVERTHRQSAIVQAMPTFTQSKHGMVTADMQPLDLDAAITLSKWFAEGGLYVKKFENAAQIFTIIAKARELGLKLTVVLDNYHIVEGQPRPSADLIRALAERDPSFDYLMPIEQGPTRCVWEGKNKRHPRAVQYPYTIEEAKAAGLVKLSQYGKPNNWMVRPQDMLNKTAASKLARQLWPGATMGLYCLEEMGYDVADLEAA